MSFPDQCHINHVSEALWRQPKSTASILVGSGFSLNAKNIRPESSTFPLWHELAKKICEKIYPDQDSNNYKRAISEASASSGFLKLAQEFEATFGRDSLHRFLIETIPNDDFEPDDLHRRLLNLPWNDIFTTNWDTLLEKTRTSVPDRFYNVIHTQEELALSYRPRIIKLHGSFPAYFPLIFTEEDYRKYPKNYAPFVNTVQQSMMESTFFLIGFSGDDPNFLHWSGWVRDNLGKSSPNIYIGGWLELSPVRRRMLEERNIIPIDLSTHPNAHKWPNHLRHRYAMEWIITSLEVSKPYDLTKWPDSRESVQPKFHEYLEPIEIKISSKPVKESSFASSDLDENKEEMLAAVKGELSAWRHNRELYPGWLYIPTNKQRRFGLTTNSWERFILKSLDSFTLIESFNALYELNWRKEVSLEPLSDELVEAIEFIFNKVDLVEGKMDESEIVSDDKLNVREKWLAVHLNLLTNFRFKQDLKKYNEVKNKLQSFIKDSSECQHRIAHEEYLKYLWDFDYVSLEREIDNWDVCQADPIWIIRKASLLSELNRTEEAKSLIKNALKSAREHQHNPYIISSLSREGCILVSALPYSRDIMTHFGLDDPFSRLTELSIYSCDALGHKRDLYESLINKPNIDDTNPFDLGSVRGESINFSNEKYERWVNTRVALRFCEVSGIPGSANHTIVSSDLLKLCSRELRKYEYHLSLSICIREANSEDDKLIDYIFSRSSIATMPIDSVNELYVKITDAIDYASQKIHSSSTRSIFWLSRLRVFLEVLSRIVLRFDDDKTAHVFNKALHYYSSDIFINDFWLHKSLKHLLERCWETITNDNKVDFVLEILSAPIISNNQNTISEFYPDPGDLIIDTKASSCPERNLLNEKIYTNIVRIIVDGLNEGGSARKRAALRLVPLSLCNILTETEANELGEALWNIDCEKNDLLPTGTTLYDWVFLTLPSPKHIDAEVNFRHKWLSKRDLENTKQLNEYLFQIGNSLACIRRDIQALTLSHDEVNNLLSSVETWLEYPIPSSNEAYMDIFEHGYNELHGVIGVQFILSEIEFPSQLAESLYKKILLLIENNIPAFRLCCTLIKTMPNRLEEISTIMRRGLSSQNEEMVIQAILGLEIWLTQTINYEISITPPPIDLIREIGMNISLRKKTALYQSLSFACWIFNNGTKGQKDSISSYTLDGLRYLFEELRYENLNESDNSLDIPLVRSGCIQLALAMSKDGFDKEKTINDWLMAATDDPLPEVRNAERSSVRFS